MLQKLLRLYSYSGGFGDLFRVYQTYLNDIQTKEFAHNDYLHLMVERGVPIAASVIVLVWGVLVEGGLRPSETQKGRSRVLGYGLWIKQCRDSKLGGQGCEGAGGRKAEGEI